MTYYPTKRDGGLVIDCTMVENTGEGEAPNPYWITLPQNTTFVQLNDLAVDVNLTRWGFYRSLTEEERMLDPWYVAKKRAKERESFLIEEFKK